MIKNLKKIQVFEHQTLHYGRDYDSVSFEEKHFKALQQEFPQSKILLIDGEMCSWYGSRMLEVPGYFEQLFTD